ncbi:MAG: sulfatase-like hydrolase/transferase, partial [Spirochaetia bacterium]|nr:sulfatase-like hydrolase/transferase [Spirochaetia bacterium]
YDNSIRITDSNIHLMIRELKKRKLFKNTIIVFLSDHGEAFYEHFIYGHMNSLHYELVDIPLFFHFPEKIRPARIFRPANIVDVYPSLLVLAGFSENLKSMDFLEGSPLFKKSSVQGPDDSIEFHSENYIYEPYHDNRSEYIFKMATVVGGAWKMKRNSHKAFGIHTAVITHEGKLIREDEENGLRYFYFPPGYRIEKRLEVNPLSEAPSSPVRKLYSLLPEGPER